MTFVCEISSEKNVLTSPAESEVAIEVFRFQGLDPEQYKQPTARGKTSSILTSSQQHNGTPGGCLKYSTQRRRELTTVSCDHRILTILWHGRDHQILAFLNIT